MASTTPFNQLTGALQAYLAPKNEPEPAVNATPAGNWVLLGATDGDQAQENSGAATKHRDNDHTGPVKAVRPEEDVMFTFTVVGLTLENWARIIRAIGNLTSAAGPPATTKMPLKRGQVVTEYALLMRGAAMSPYGNYPGQFYCPRCYNDSEPKPTFGKGNRPGLDVALTALEDDTQSNDLDKMGWVRVQTS
jgi:hypothetical protein